ncbi:TPA: hypothetical protein DF272_05910 [Candidatus Falkowbacteria bacterium]|nr:hypothetical protein [Candidatus Falkowbacteria bacterium]
MKTQKGYSIIDILITIALVVLVVLIILVMFYFVSKDSRDVKRISDMDAIRSAMARVKVQTGTFIDSGCGVGAVSECQSGLLSRVLPTVAKMSDPKGRVLCTQNCTEACEYSFVTAPTEAEFSVLFYLETGAGNYSQKGCYVLTQDGIKLR